MSIRSFCSLGPACIISFRLCPLNFIAESNTLLTFVVALSSRVTGKCGRNHFGLTMDSSEVNFLMHLSSSEMKALHCIF